MLTLALLLACPTSQPTADAASDSAPTEALDTCDTSGDAWPERPEADDGCVVQYLCCEYSCWTDAEYAEWAADPADCDVECCGPPATQGRCAHDAAAGTCAFEG